MCTNRTLIYSFSSLRNIPTQHRKQHKKTTHPTPTQKAATHLLDVHVVQVVLHELDAGVVVGGVELVGDVPAQGAKLASLLDNGVQEAHSVQHGLPLRHVGDVQEVLRDASVGALQTRLDSLWRLIGELDGDLQTGRKKKLLECYLRLNKSSQINN